MNATTNHVQIEPAWLQVLQTQIGSLRFGVVQIVVHDSRVVQIERTVKVRLGEPDEKSTSPIRLDALQNPGGAQ